MAAICFPFFLISLCSWCDLVLKNNPMTNSKNLYLMQFHKAVLFNSSFSINTKYQLKKKVRPNLRLWLRVSYLVNRRAKVPGWRSPIIFNVSSILQQYLHHCPRRLATLGQPLCTMPWPWQPKVQLQLHSKATASFQTAAWAGAMGMPLDS